MDEAATKRDWWCFDSVSWLVIQWDCSTCALSPHSAPGFFHSIVIVVMSSRCIILYYYTTLSEQNLAPQYIEPTLAQLALHNSYVLLFSSYTHLMYLLFSLYPFQLTNHILNQPWGHFSLVVLTKSPSSHCPNSFMLLSITQLHISQPPSFASLLHSILDLDSNSSVFSM